MKTKLNLLSKFIITYLFVGIIGFTLISTVVYDIDYDNMISKKSSSMYKQATDITKSYDSKFYNTEANIKTVSSQLSTVAALNDTRIMFITASGEIFLDTGSTSFISDKEIIRNFDPTVSNRYYQVGNFYNYFNNEQISVLAPVTQGFLIVGYVAIHAPVSTVTNDIYNLYTTNYITFSIMMVLSLIFILIFVIQIDIPLKQITRGAEEYGKGHFSYKIKKLNNDEIGRVGDSLNYMASELGEMDQFQKKFIANISHDFRSPLTSIKGYLEAISDGTIPPEMAPKYLNIMLFETERLTKLTNNLLTLNDLDPKSVRLDITSFNINESIKHIIETFGGRCQDKGITFNLTFSDTKLYVNGDIEKIQQVLYNLIDNAIKFSSPNSSISITIKEKGEKAYISVKDNGTGIPKENIKKIWERFYKTDTSRGKDKKGSGLGLSIVKEILTAHNENIDVISTEGVGTEFIFTMTKTKLSKNN